VVAALYGVAEIHRAGISVVTVQGDSAIASALGALVEGGADVSVITGRVVRRVNATDVGLAGVICAPVGVVAVHRRDGLAEAVHALVVRRAGVQIIAGVTVGLMQTPQGVIAGVVGAGIVVLARVRQLSLTEPSITGVVGGARAPIITGGLIYLVGTSRVRFADVIGARVGVIAGQCAPRHTDSRGALIPH